MHKFGPLISDFLCVVSDIQEVCDKFKTRKIVADTMSMNIINIKWRWGDMSPYSPPWISPWNAKIVSEWLSK